MAGLSKEQFERLEGVLEDPGKRARLSAGPLAQAESAVKAYRAETGSLVQKLDPEHPLLAQALATAPASTHPGGDEAAADDWQRNPGGSNPGGKGTVIYYEVPLSVARQKLLEHPEILPGLGFVRGLPTTENLATMDADSSIFRSYQDYDWRQTADAATKAGKAAYRYSKAPWLQDGGIMPAIQSLGMKLGASTVPALEGLSAFVGGVDDTATFGAIRAGEETADAADGPPEAPGPGNEIVGGAMGTAQAEGAGLKRVNELADEEHPNLRIAGQVAGAVPGLASGLVKGAAKGVGMLSASAGQTISRLARGVESLAPWSATNALFDLVAKGGKGALAKFGLEEGLAPVTTSLVAGGLAAGTAHAAQEGVDAVAGLAQTGETGTSLGGAASRTWDAAKFGGVLGGLGSVVQQGSAAGADWVREGARYNRLPGRLERAGVEFEFGKGPVPPRAVTAAAEEAKALDVSPEEILAERVAPKVEEGAKAIHTEAVTRVKAEDQAFQATEEGQAKLPMANFTATAVKKLRGDMEARAKDSQFDRGGVPDPVGHKGKGHEVKALFNQEIDGLSLEPVKGAVSLSPEEAQAFLEPEKQVALRRMKPKKAPEGGPRAPFEPADRATLEAHRTIDVTSKEASRPPLVERPTAPGPGAWRSPAGAAGEPLPARAAASEPAPPPLIEGPVPTRPSLAISPDVSLDTAPPAPERAARPVVTPPAKAGPAKASSPMRAPAPGKGDKRAPLAKVLRRRGVEAVYVIPRQHSAEHTETLLDAIDGYQPKGAKAPQNKDLLELDRAVRLDRDARPMNGEAGGWSKFKREQHQRLNVADEVQQRAVPQGDAYSAVSNYAHRGRGELKRTRALHAAAKQAGPEAEQALRQTRVPVMIEQLERRTAPARKRGSGTLWGAVTNVADTATIRGAYPMLKALEGPLGPVGMGKAGRAALARPTEKAPDADEAPRRARYAAWREEYLARRKRQRSKERRP